jgi:drug/metabolite transporter (DMT)-like permease
MSIPQAVTALLALLSALCFAAFGIIGSRVDDQGLLREPFFLLPMGWLLALTAMLAGLFAIVHTVRSARDTLTL